jgi:hypothetical protein
MDGSILAARNLLADKSRPPGCGNLQVTIPHQRDRKRAYTLAVCRILPM